MKLGKILRKVVDPLGIAKKASSSKFGRVLDPVGSRLASKVLGKGKQPDSSANTRQSILSEYAKKPQKATSKVTVK
jgi:hypothetical protein